MNNDELEDLLRGLRDANNAIQTFCFKRVMHFPHDDEQRNMARRVYVYSEFLQLALDLFVHKPDQETLDTILTGCRRIEAGVTEMQETWKLGTRKEDNALLQDISEFLSCKTELLGITKSILSKYDGDGDCGDADDDEHE